MFKVCWEFWNFETWTSPLNFAFSYFIFWETFLSGWLLFLYGNFADLYLKCHSIDVQLFSRLAFLVLNAQIKLIFYPLLVVQRVNFIQQMTIGASIVFVWEYLWIVRELQSHVNLQICPEVWKKWISMRKPWDFHSPTRISRKRSVNCRSILGVENFTTTKYKTSNQM